MQKQTIEKTKQINKEMLFNVERYCENCKKISFYRKWRPSYTCCYNCYGEILKKERINDESKKCYLLANVEFSSDKVKYHNNKCCLCEQDIIIKSKIEDNKTVIICNNCNNVLQDINHLLCKLFLKKKESDLILLESFKVIDNFIKLESGDTEFYKHVIFSLTYYDNIKQNTKSIIFPIPSILNIYTVKYDTLTESFVLPEKFLEFIKIIITINEFGDDKKNMNIVECDHNTLLSFTNFNSNFEILKADLMDIPSFIRKL